MTECAKPGCGQRIIWARTPEGKSMPVNMGSAGDETGTLAVWKVNERLVCRVLAKDEDVKAGEWRGVTHWATCIAADDFRGPQGWSHNPRRRRWEWRQTARGRVEHWINEVLVQTDWEVAQKYAAEACNGELLPDSARPPEQQGSLL